MSQVRAFSRFTSLAVIVAVVAITVLMTCGVAFGAPMNCGAPSGSDACAVGSHDSLAAAGVSTESPKITPALSAVVSSGTRLGVPQGIANRGAGLWAELPPLSDPRHGRIRV